MTKKTSTFLLSAEVAEIFSVPESRLEELVREGKLRQFRDGDQINYKRTDIESLAQQKMAVPSQEWLKIDPMTHMYRESGDVDRADRIIARFEATMRTAKRVVIAAVLVAAFSTMLLIVSLVK